MDLSTRSWLEVFGADAPHAADPDLSPVTEPDPGWDGDLTVAGSVRHPDDADLPILSSLLDSLRGSTAPVIDDGWETVPGVAPRPVPLDSLQSLPVAARML